MLISALHMDQSHPAYHVGVDVRHRQMFSNGHQRDFNEQTGLKLEVSS